MRALERRGVIARDDSFLIVFGGDFDAALFRSLGFPNVTFSSIGTGEVRTHRDAVDAKLLDATSLPFEDGSFDHVFAHAGIHHASRPHAAVCEMYRVARKSAIFFEAQDSLLMRALCSLNLVSTYEWNAIVDSGYERGGVDDKPIPNYVYRWTRREVEKLVRSLDPAHVPSVHVFREWSFEYKRFARRLQSTPLAILPAPVLDACCRVADRALNGLLRHQGNLFGVCIEKPSELQPWIVERDGVLRLDPDRGHQKPGERTR